MLVAPLRPGFHRPNMLDSRGMLGGTKWHGVCLSPLRPNLTTEVESVMWTLRIATLLMVISLGFAAHAETKPRYVPKKIESQKHCQSDLIPLSWKPWLSFTSLQALWA